MTAEKEKTVMELNGIDWESAQDLYDEILKCKDIKEYFKKYNDTFIEPDLPKQLKTMMKKKGYNATDIIKSTNIEKSYFYQILNGRRNPSRDKVIKIALSMELNLRETQRLLLSTEKCVLYPRRKRDAALISCICKQCSIDRTQILLYEWGIKILD